MFLLEDQQKKVQYNLKMLCHLGFKKKLLMNLISRGLFVLLETLQAIRKLTKVKHLQILKNLKIV